MTSTQHCCNISTQDLKKTLNAFRPFWESHTGGKMWKQHSGATIGCKDETSWWHLIGLMAFNRVARPMVVTLVQQYRDGEKPTVILYTYMNRHAGTPNRTEYWCCCLHIKNRCDLCSVPSNIRTGPTDANAFRGHRLTTQKGYTPVAPFPCCVFSRPRAGSATALSTFSGLATKTWRSSSRLDAFRFSLQNFRPYKTKCSHLNLLIITQEV